MKCFVCGRESERVTCAACLVAPPADEANGADVGDGRGDAILAPALPHPPAADSLPVVPRAVGRVAATTRIAPAAAADRPVGDADRRRSTFVGGPVLSPRERRVCRRVAASGAPGLGEDLCRLDGALVAGRFAIDSLRAVGNQAAVYLARDLFAPGVPRCIVKVAIPLLEGEEFDALRARRALLAAEAEQLAAAASRTMPRCLGMFGGPLDVPPAEDGPDEPVLVLEHLPGFDLDRWLARVHASRIRKPVLRARLDEIAVVLLTSLAELSARGLHLADLRPGRLRVHGRGPTGVRLIGGTSLVRADDAAGGFPHVAAYLPPELFRASREGQPIAPTPHVQAVMAGRTLYEVATGRVPMPGEPVPTAILYGENLSPAVAETVDRLCRGVFADVAEALVFLSKRFTLPAVTPRARYEPAPRLSPAEPAPASVPIPPRVPAPVEAPVPPRPEPTGQLTAEILAPLEDELPPESQEARPVAPPPRAAPGRMLATDSCVLDDIAVAQAPRGDRAVAIDPAADLAADPRVVAPPRDDVVVDLPPPSEFLRERNGPTARAPQARPAAPRPADVALQLMLTQSVRPGAPRSRRPAPDLETSAAMRNLAALTANHDPAA